jgi:hypothetical protein
MSSPTIKAIRATKSSFVPCQQEIVLIGRMYVSLYPKVDLSMTDAEKALAFQHNKLALTFTDLDQRAHLLTLADHLNLMLTAKSGLTNWERKLLQNWENFQYLTILSWHDAKGDVIANKTSATNPSILKPIQDGKRDDCRSAGIKFDQVQLELDYSELQQLRLDCRHLILSYTVSTTFSYLKLPRMLPMRGVTHTASQPTLAATTSVPYPQRNKRTILNVRYQDGPYNLLAPT